MCTYRYCRMSQEQHLYSRVSLQLSETRSESLKAQPRLSKRREVWTGTPRLSLQFFSATSLMSGKVALHSHITHASRPRIL